MGLEGFVEGASAASWWGTSESAHAVTAPTPTHTHTRTVPYQHRERSVSRQLQHPAVGTSSCALGLLPRLGHPSASSYQPVVVVVVDDDADDNTNTNKNPAVSIASRT